MTPNDIEREVAVAYKSGVLTGAMGGVWVVLVLISLAILFSPANEPIYLMVDLRHNVSIGSKVGAACALVVYLLLGAVIFRRPKAADI